MKSQACEACAKRKVRCNRAEPSCSNCIRRKTGLCVYPSPSPFERIKQLEETIVKLGSDPSGQLRASSRRSSDAQNKNSSNTPIFLQQAGQSIYLESQGWQKWIDASRLHDSVKTSDDNQHKSIHNPGSHLPHAFEGCIWRASAADHGASASFPVPSQRAIQLYKYFLRRVEPIIKINFSWTLQKLEAAISMSDNWIQLGEGEQGMLIAICYFGVVSLSNEESMRHFEQPRSRLLEDHRLLCENFFASTNMLAINDISILKALCLYMRAGVDVISTQSLWSLMGLVSRSAEQMGIHRDGSALGLSPVDTEERRRLWWQLQHLDLILAVKSGKSALTFTADWDAQLPLNIEDRDISPTTKETPRERVGLTKFSYTLFTYWILSQQRDFRRSQLGKQTVVDRSLLGPLTDEMINNLESGLNKNFLQYCDPINSVDALLQVSGRAVICVLRLRRLHEMRLSTVSFDKETHERYMAMCMQSLRYVIATYSQPALERFQWLAEASFSWHALIGFLTDVPHLADAFQIEEAWELLTNLYNNAAFLMDLTDDRRRLLAAQSIVATWNACQQKPGMENSAKPEFLSRLEESMRLRENNDIQASQDVNTSSKSLEHPYPHSSLDDLDTAESFALNFSDIDWSFWESLS